MRMYFSSAQNAALKLNGIFLGMIGPFEQFIDLSVNDKIFVELLPTGDCLPLSFLLNEKFFSAPPEGLEVYLFEGGALVHAAAFPARPRETKVLKQERLGDFFATLYDEGALRLSLERKDKFALSALPAEFSDCDFAVHTLAGAEFLSVSAPCEEGYELLVFSENAEKVFSNRVRTYEFTDSLQTEFDYGDPARHSARADWRYDGTKFELQSYSVRAEKTYEPQSTPKQLIPLLFFNEVLVRGEPERYLCEALRPRAGEFAEYLGNYTGVNPPPDLFALRHPDSIAAGLVYPERANLFQVKFFETVLDENNLITNVKPCPCAPF